MPTSKWMMHIELTCGSIEYVGETLTPETLTALVAALHKLGIVKDRANGCRDVELNEGKRGKR